MIEATNEFDGWTKRSRRFRTPYGQYSNHAFRMVLEIPVTGMLNMELWKALKPPQGWKKNARQKWKNEVCVPVRFICYDADAALTAEQIETLRIQILLMVKR